MGEAVEESNGQPKGQVAVEWSSREEHARIGDIIGRVRRVGYLSSLNPVRPSPSRSNGYNMGGGCTHKRELSD